MKKNDYFKLRNVESWYYDTYRLPWYISKNLPISKDSKILDIWCWFWQTLREISKLWYKNITWIDVSNEAVDFCTKTWLSVRKIDDIITFAKNSNEKYDFIIMSHVLEHIKKEDIIDTLSNIMIELIESWWSLCVMVPNAQSNTGSYWMYEDFTHSTLFTAWSIYYVLKAAGFSDIKILDPNWLDGSIYINPIFKLIKICCLKLYNLNKYFWNMVTSSSYHRKSQNIYSFELKVLARK